jgi:hypothetical protein
MLGMGSVLAVSSSIIDPIPRAVLAHAPIATAKTFSC